MGTSLEEDLVRRTVLLITNVSLGLGIHIFDIDYDFGNYLFEIKNGTLGLNRYTFRSPEINCLVPI